MDGQGYQMRYATRLEQLDKTWDTVNKMYEESTRSLPGGDS